MDLTPRTTVTTPTEEQEWLGSKHGTDCTDTGTLDVSTFPTAVADGVIKSGTPVKKDGTSGLYELAATGSACDGHVYRDVLVHADATHLGFALLWHGKVVAAKVPLAGFAAAVATDGAPHIRYV